MKSAIAVVLGARLYNSLGVIRSCGEAGLRVYFLITSPASLIFPERSKYVIGWKEIAADSDQLSLALKQIAEQYPNENLALIPTGDSEAILLDQLNSSKIKGIHDTFMIPSAAGHLHRVMRKDLMSHLAMECGLVSPKSEVLTLSNGAPPTPPHDLSIPLIVKPLKSVDGSKGDISLVNSTSTWGTVVKRFYDHGCPAILVQEFIDSQSAEEVAVPGVRLLDGNVLIAGCVHKLRTFGNGSTTYAVMTPSDSKIPTAEICTFLKECNYFGIFDIEFIVANGTWYFIECNYRNGAYGYASTRSGCNLPATWVTQRHIAGERRTITFMEERSDILHTLRGSVPLLKWMWQFLSCDCHLTYQLQDLKPTMRIPSFIKKIIHSS